MQRQTLLLRVARTNVEIYAVKSIKEHLIDNVYVLKRGLLNLNANSGRLEGETGSAITSFYFSILISSSAKVVAAKRRHTGLCESARGAVDSTKLDTLTWEVTAAFTSMISKSFLGSPRCLTA